MFSLLVQSEPYRFFSTCAIFTNARTTLLKVPTGKKFGLGTDEIWYRQVVYTPDCTRAKPFFWGPIPISPEPFHKISVAYLPTLQVFPGVSKFFIKSPDLPVRASNLPDKMDVWAFLCFSLKFSQFFHKIRTFFIHRTVSGTFLHMFSQWQRLVCHYNDESAFWSHVRHVRCHRMS